MNAMKCPGCGADVRDDEARCPTCGKAIDWREPHAADVIDDDDEKVIENTRPIDPTRPLGPTR